MKIKIKKFYLAILFVFLPLVSSLFAEEVVVLKNNFQKAQPGDYLVITANKTNTLMLIHDKKDSTLAIEEITIPENRKPSTSWREWLQNGASGHTSWVKYNIDVQTGAMINYYSFSKNNWYEISEADNFLSKLLNLKFTRIPHQTRKKLGPRITSGPDNRQVWQPRMVLEGKSIPGVRFDGWRTRWPKDGSDLSSKTIEIYIPEDNISYPAYFPYWLQISGIIGKARIRIIDSGRNLKSPKAGQI